jgi:hypothetical protein
MRVGTGFGTHSAEDRTDHLNDLVEGTHSVTRGMDRWINSRSAWPSGSDLCFPTSRGFTALAARGSQGLTLRRDRPPQPSREVLLWLLDNACAPASRAPLRVDGGPALAIASVVPTGRLPPSLWRRGARPARSAPACALTLAFAFGATLAPTPRHPDRAPARSERERSGLPRASAAAAPCLSAFRCRRGARPQSPVRAITNPSCPRPASAPGSPSPPA